LRHVALMGTLGGILRLFLSDFDNAPGNAVESKEAERRIGTAMMEYRNIEFTVVQGIERRVWKWSASVAGVVIMGNEQTRSAAVAAAEKAIDRALAQTKMRLVPRDDQKNM
jgi:hypothetical protein